MLTALVIEFILIIPIKSKIFDRCYDNVDEVVAARSVTFDPSGQKIYVGLKNEVCIFDVNIPGKKCIKRKTVGTENHGSLTGVISSIAVSYFYSKQTFVSGKFPINKWFTFPIC